MFKVSCHCGNIALKANKKPQLLTSCNCSICRRIASLWASFELEEVSITQGEHPLSVYTWGQQNLSFHYCTNCSCITHYVAINTESKNRIAINARMAENPDDVNDLEIRQFDGDDTWKYLA